MVDLQCMCDGQATEMREIDNPEHLRLPFTEYQCPDCKNIVREVVDLYPLPESLKSKGE